MEPQNATHSANNVALSANNGSDNATPQNPPPVVAAVTYAKPFPDVSKIEMFGGQNFKRWQERVYSILDVHVVATALTDQMPDTSADQKILDDWTYANKESMIVKYTAEDAGKQKFIIGNYYRWEMTDEIDLKTQINQYHKLLEELKAENITLPDEFIAGLLIEKLPQTWKDYKQQLKRKNKQLSLADLITHIIIQDTNRNEIKTARAKALASRENMVQVNKKRYEHKPNKRTDYNKPNYVSRVNNPTFKNSGGNYYVCGKPGHWATQCRHRKRNDNPPKSNAKLVEGDDIIATVVSQALLMANMND